MPAFFVPNVLNFATEGKNFRYGSVGMPVELWGPWREEPDGDSLVPIGLAAVKEPFEGVLPPAAVLDFLRFFMPFATDKKHRKIKTIARFQQLGHGRNGRASALLPGNLRRKLATERILIGARNGPGLAE